MIPAAGTDPRWQTRPCAVCGLALETQGLMVAAVDRGAADVIQIHSPSLALVCGPRCLRAWAAERTTPPV